VVTNQWAHGGKIYDRTDDQTYDNYVNRDKTYKMLQFKYKEGTN